MTQQKSKWPDLKELGSIGNTLFQGIKKSIEHIIHDYKKKREPEKAPPVAEKKTTASAKKTTTSASKSTKSSEKEE